MSSVCACVHVCVCVRARVPVVLLLGENLVIASSVTTSLLSLLFTSQFSITVTKHLRESTYKEKRFVLAPSLQGSSP
jgi:hypothetical protein